jgi:hypothetical protein
VAGPHKVRATLHNEAIEFQRKVEDNAREREIPVANVHIADEAGMWTGSVRLRTKVDPATVDAGVLREGDDGRDTGMMTPSAAGNIDAQFLPHRRQVTGKVGDETMVVQKAVSWMGAAHMVDWTRQFLDRCRDDESLLLVMDRLDCHRNWTVLRQLREGRVEPLLLPR